jgi:hypothetical protein
LQKELKINGKAEVSQGDSEELPKPTMLFNDSRKGTKNHMDIMVTPGKPNSRRS